MNNKLKLRNHSFVWKCRTYRFVPSLNCRSSESRLREIAVKTENCRRYVIRIMQIPIRDFYKINWYAVWNPEPNRI